MKKLFIVSDVHGFYNEMLEALYEHGFEQDNKDHIFCSCGDYLDRGNQPAECINFANNLSYDRKILIKGNHEDLLEDILYKKQSFNDYDFINGTVKTLENISKISLPDNFTDVHEYESFEAAIIQTCKLNINLKNYLDSCVNFIELGKYIFTHGWIPVLEHYKLSGGYISYLSDWRDANDEQWKDARWINGMSAWADGIREPGRIIICGHWCTSWGHKLLHGSGNKHCDIFYDDGIIALDGGTALTGKVNCLVLEIEDEIWPLKI